MDVGALTPPLWGFEEREKLMVFYERASGARMHANYFRPGGVHQDLPDALIDDIADWCDAFPKVLRRHRGPDHRQPHLQAAQRRHRRGDQGGGHRLGLLGRDAARLGHRLGPAQSQPYDCYDELEFDIPLGKNGDCYDRYLCRMEEMRQSMKIMQQCSDKLRNAPGPVLIEDNKVAPPRRGEMKRSMEALIHHFKLYTEGFRTPAGRGLRLRRGAQGRVRRLSGRPTAPTSRTAARSARRASRTCRPWTG